MDLQLQDRLEKVAARVIAVRLAWRLVALWSMLALIGLACWWLIQWRNWQSGPVVAWTLAGLAGVLASWLGLRAMLKRRDLREAARRIEQRFPSLGERLLAAIDQRPISPDGQFGYLQQKLIEATVAHDDQNQWKKSVPGRD